MRGGLKLLSQQAFIYLI